MKAYRAPASLLLHGSSAVFVEHLRNGGTSCERDLPDNGILAQFTADLGNVCMGGNDVDDTWWNARARSQLM